jgi:hypothetical protein
MHESDIKPLDTIVVEQSLDDLRDWAASFAVRPGDAEMIRSGMVAAVSMADGQVRIELIIPDREP